MFVTPSIWCYNYSFFRSYNLCLIFWIYFPICSTILYTSIPTIFFSNSLTWRSHNHFVEIRHNHILLARMLFVQTHFHTFHLVETTHPTCVFPSLVDDMYIIGLALDVVLTFLRLLQEFFNIRAFSAISEVCSLVSIGVGPFYITSSWFFYFQFIFSYFEDTSGIQIIRCVICD
jgi:hypothetical protein